MKKRFLYGAGIFLLALSMTLLVWQGSFTFGSYGPSDPNQTFLYWTASTLVFLLTVTLGFMLFRTGLKLYIERRSNRVGSRMKTKLVVGALALSLLPTFFAVLWGVYVLNRNLDKWFSLPAEGVQLNLKDIGEGIDRVLMARANTEAQWLAQLPGTRDIAARSAVDGNLQAFCDQRGVAAAAIKVHESRWIVCGSEQSLKPMVGRTVVADAPVLVDGKQEGYASVAIGVPMDLAKNQAEIQNYTRAYSQLAVDRKDIRNFYLMLMALITLFILFVATWIALFLAKQISIPIEALLDGAQKVRTGRLSHRVNVRAIDELATLVRAFNEMTQELESSSRELEERRRFTEAILENIPTGVISLSADGRIQKMNRALQSIFPPERVARATRLEDLFSSEDAAEVQYLMKRARRTGLASRQLELAKGQQTLNAAITVSALQSTANPAFVLVIEDTTDLLRAQKAAAWHEVARRVAHEIKNPLTPIALSAERLQRQVDRTPVPADFARIVRECTSIIEREVESVKTLVNEFAQFSRFPAAQPALSDLNEVVEDGLAVFAGRLQGIEMSSDLASDLPMVNIDREQFKRVVVNLVDNAAEAMRDSLVKRLYVATQLNSSDFVELTVADTGCGVSSDDKEKLFLPYFSTKNRGTGLGLAIVNHILSEHQARIRVEDNPPAGTRFTVEIPLPAPAEVEMKQAEVRA